MELTIFQINATGIGFCSFIRMVQTTAIRVEEERMYPNEGRLSEASKRRESLRPNLHSGVPVRNARIIICPDTSARSAVPECQSKSCVRATCSRHQQIDIFNHINERFVSTVLYVASSIGHYASCLCCDSWRIFSLFKLNKSERGDQYHSPFRLYGFCCDVHFQSINIRVLRVSKIQYL